jgi:hypothetical protein
MNDTSLDTRLAAARDREARAHEAIRAYEDGAQTVGSPADRVKQYQPLQDELDAAEAEVAKLEGELAG